jgi:hypothetical protein
MPTLVLRLIAGVVLAVVTATAAGAQPQKTAVPDLLVTDLQVPGGVEALLRAARVPGLPDPAVAILGFIRATHVLPTRPSNEAAVLLEAASRLQAGSEAVPLPVTADWWRSVVLKRRVPAGELAAAIFGNRRAAFIYLGLMSLDDDTLAYFAAHPAVVGAMGDHAAGAFAQWGRSIRIELGRVQVPGGDGAAAAWQAVVGEPPSAADRFIRALLSRDGGRTAYFLDAVTHLDRDRQAFALATAQGSNRIDRVKALYSSFAATKTILSESDWPVVRHPFGPAAVLRQVAVDADGRMKAPAGQAFWEAALGGDASACARAVATGAQVDAAWLADRIERQPLEMRGHWVAAVAFAQRVFGRASAVETPSACEAISAFPRSDGLLLALERSGFLRPADYVTMLRFAQQTWAGVDRRAAVIRTAQAQGILQILQQAVSVRALRPDRAQELALSLTKLPSGDDSGFRAGALGQWVRSSLLPGACPGQSSADACLVHLVSGEGMPGGSARVVEWEDDRYRVDLGAAAAVTLERVRRAQKATRIDEALNLLEAATIVSSPQAAAADLDRAATIVRAVAPAVTLTGPTLFGHPILPVRSLLDGVPEALVSNSADAVRTVAATILSTSADLLLADALVSFAYAMAIGDPDDAVLMGGNPSRGHLFDGTIGPATDAWHLPEEVQAIDRSWMVEGSVLMLRSIYAKSWLRRLSIHDPGAAVRPDPQDVRVFGETVAAFGAFDLNDEGRDHIVAAIHRGRSRVTELVASPQEFWKAAHGAGLGEWRCRAALWSARGRPGPPEAGTPNVAGYFSLAELMWLGVPDASADDIDAWGVATRPIDGGLSVRMPRTGTWEDYQGPRGVGQLPTQMADVHLAVAEALADMKLPAALAPSVAAQATWDVMAAARMAHRDDWFALVRAAQSIPRDRFLDYVSALTAIGPLVPIK